MVEDFKNLYKGVPKGYYYVGTTETKDLLFKNKWDRIYVKRKEKRPKDDEEDSSKCWYCNHNVTNQCSCNGKYKMYSIQEIENNKKK